MLKSIILKSSNSDKLQEKVNEFLKYLPNGSFKEVSYSMGAGNGFIEYSVIIIYIDIKK